MPKFLNYGTAKGLSVQRNFQNDIENLYRQKQYESQINAEREQKTRYYSELLKQHNPVSPWVTGQLENFYEDLNNKLADFVVKNPDYETDIGKMKQFREIADQYLNNDLVRKDIQSQQEFEKLKEAVNKGEISKNLYFKEMEKYNNWMQNGGDGYVFSNIKLPTYNEIAFESAKLLPYQKSIETRNNKIMEISSISDTQAYQQAMSDMHDEDKNTVIQQAFQQFKKDNPEGGYETALDFHAARLRLIKPVQEDFRAFDPAYTMSLKAKQEAQKKLVALKPHYSALVNRLSNTTTVNGNKYMANFTKFNRIGGDESLNNVESIFKIAKDGSVGKQVRLPGTYTLKNIEEMKMVNGIPMIKVALRTTVNQDEPYTKQSFQITENGKNDPTWTFGSKDELKEFIKDNSTIFNNYGDKRKLTKFNDQGESEYRNIEIDGKQYHVKSERIAEVINSDFYRDAGFESTGIYAEGVVAGLNGQKAKYPIYEGSVWMEANMNQENILNYEEQRSGQKRFNDIYQNDVLNNRNIIIDYLQNGNTDLAINHLNQTFGGPDETQTDYGSNKVDSWVPSYENGQFVGYTQEYDENGQRKERFYDLRDGKMKVKRIQ